MPTDTLKIYYQVDRKRLVDASGMPYPQGQYPSVFFTAAPQVELHLRDANNQAFPLPSEVNWCVDVDVDFNSATPPMMHVGNSSIAVDGSVVSFRLVTSTVETQAVLGTSAKIQTFLLLRAYALEDINGTDIEVTKFGALLPLTVQNVLNPTGVLPSSKDFTEELVDFLGDYFIREESDPLFTQWLEGAGGDVATSAELTNMAMWASSHIPISGTTLYQPVKYIEGPGGVLYLTKDGAPVSPPWEEE
jgi:hypothetical protein